MIESLLYNPYTNRAAVHREDDFYGRAAELRQIYTRILGGQSVWLVGERRVGKSSILNALNFPIERERFGIPDQIVFVLMDQQYIVGCSEQEFLEYLLRLISEATEIETGRPRRESLEKVAKEARERGKRLVIMMDEFDVLVHNQDILGDLFAFLRSWSNQFAVPFVLVTRDGSINRVTEVEKLGSAFLNIFGTLYIGPLESDDARDLIETPSQLAGIQFSQDETELLISLAGYFPLFLQIACYHLFDLKLSDASEEERREQLERNFAFEANPHFEYLLNGLPESERAALRSWITEGSAEDKTAESELEKKGILIRDRAGRRLFSKVFSELACSRDNASKGS